MTDDCLYRFLLDDLDISGAVVRLGPAWRQMTEGRDYPAPVVDHSPARIKTLARFASVRKAWPASSPVRRSAMRWRQHASC